MDDQSKQKICSWAQQLNNVTTCDQLQQLWDGVAKATPELQLIDPPTNCLHVGQVMWERVGWTNIRAGIVAGYMQVPTDPKDDRFRQKTWALILMRDGSFFMAGQHALSSLPVAP